jgi:Predicted membrane protein (DUF2214)
MTRRNRTSVLMRHRVAKMSQLIPGNPNAIFLIDTKNPTMIILATGVFIVTLACSLHQGALGWAPPAVPRLPGAHTKRTSRLASSRLQSRTLWSQNTILSESLRFQENDGKSNVAMPASDVGLIASNDHSYVLTFTAAVTVFGDWLFNPEMVLAADGSPIPNALLAYAHYLSMLGSTGALVTQRLQTGPNMTADQWKTFSTANIVYVVCFIALIVTGYLRSVDVRICRTRLLDCTFSHVSVSSVLDHRWADPSVRERLRFLLPRTVVLVQTGQRRSYAFPYGVSNK